MTKPELVLTPAQGAHLQLPVFGARVSRQPVTAVALHQPCEIHHRLAARHSVLAAFVCHCS